MTRVARSLSALVVLSALGGCASSPSVLTPPTFVRYVVERDMVVRQAANGGAGEVGRLPAGTTLTAWAEDVGENWFRLHSDSGNVGYIFGMPFRRAD